MAGEDDLNPNVVLTADTSQYERSMDSSAKSTMDLGTAIDTIGAKLDKLSKSAGKKLVNIGVADITAITGATAAYAAYEKQISSLQAQAAVLNKTQEGAGRAMGSYERSVQSLRQTFGTTVAEAAALTQQLSKVADRTQSIDRLSNTFVKMSNATGESTVQLATSVTNLQRVMGTPQRDTKGYADQLTTLAAGANTSATALADFASQLAPLGRSVGMSQTDITGIATAFTKAGQDGYQASTVFSKMVSDIAYATQTGSPDLSKYSNLIGVTMDQFKDMSGTEQVVKIFDQLNRLGPRAITELNQLGYDGMRTMRAITAMSNQSGGIGTSIQKARAAFADGSTDRGSKAAMSGMYDEFQKMRSEVAMTAESIGSAFAPAATKMFEIIEKIAGGFRSLMDGPFGSFLKGIMAVVAPIATVSGTLLIMAGTMAKLATAALALRGAGAIGFQNARAGGGFMVPGGTVENRGRMVTPRAIATGANASWFQRAMFNAGSAVGGAVGVRGDGPGVLARAAGLGMRGVGAGAGMLGQALYSPLGYSGVNDPTTRWRMFNANTLGGSFAGAGRAISNIPVGRPTNAPGGIGTTQLRFTPAQQAAMSAAGVNTAAVGASTAAFKNLAKEAGPLQRGFQGLNRGVGTLMTSMGSAAAGAGRWAGQVGAGAIGTAVSGVPAMMGYQRGAGALVNGLTMATSPLGMLGLMGAGFGGYMAYDKMRDKSVAEYQDLSGSGNAYRQAGGLSNNPVWSPSVEDPTPQISMQSALTIDANDIDQATRDSHKLTNKGLYGMSEDESTAYLSTQWDTYKGNAQSRQAVVLDLIDKFDAETARSIVSRLDTGDVPGLDAFDLKDLDGVSKEDAGARLNGALAMVGDLSSGAGITGGAGASLRTQAQGYGQIMGQLLQSSGDSTDKTYAILEDKLFGGETDLSQGQVENLLKTKQMNTTGDGYEYVMPENLTGILEKDPSLSNAQNNSIVQATALSNAAVRGYDGAEAAGRTYLANLGVENTEDIDIKDFNEVQKALLGVLNATDMGISEDPNSLQNRLRDLGGVGGKVADSYALRDASTNTEDIDKQYKAIDDLYNKSFKNNKNIVESYIALGDVQAEIGNTSDHSYQIIDAVRQRQVQSIEFAQTLMTRGETYSSQADIFQMQTGDSSTLNADQKEAATNQFISQTADQAQYFKQALLQQRQFELSMDRAQEDFGTSRQRMDEQYNLSRARAQEDFHLQRVYQEQDYQLSRTRAEADFSLSQRRSTQAYERSMRRGYADFNLSRKRQEEDYNHSVEQMIKSQAQTLYNVYERMTIKRTSSSNFITLNLRDQVDAMKQQAQELDQVRGLGLGDDAINQLGLGKTENAQQLSRLVEDLKANPEQVAELNGLVSESLSAAGELVTDESSNEWAEWERNYELSRDRALEDFKKSVKRGRKDFNTQMNQMEADFQKSMTRQAEDYEKAQERQQKAFSKSMERSAADYATAVDNMVTDFGKSMSRAQEDMDLLNQNVAGNLKDILVAATQELSGETQKQAQLVLDTFNGLDTELGDTGVNIMKRMADIFGFDYTPPKGSGKGGKGGSSNPNDNTTDQTPHGYNSGHAAGGVLPGPKSVSSDNMHFYSKDHGMLSLAGGEGIMVPEWVDMMGGPSAVKAMNDAARGKRRAFWQGGVMPLPGATSIEQHLSGYPADIWSGDLNWPGRSDYGKPIVAYQSGIARPFDYGADSSYGRGVMIEGGATNSLYAHMSAIVKKIAGEKVAAGQVIGYVGDYGNTGNPPTSHLHFEVKDGSWDLPWVGNDALTGKRGGQVDVNGNVIGMNSVLKDYYPQIENAASQVMLNGGLFEDGFMSKMINKQARKAWKKFDKGMVPTATTKGTRWAAQGGIVDTPQYIGVGEAGPEAILPLDGRGAAFINDIMSRSLIGVEAKSSNLTGGQPMAGVVHQNYSIDKSTSFTGAITVVANNPAEFLSQMKQRQRMAALSQPVLGGSRA